DNGCVNSIFVHNPGAVDPDGDSLAYEFVNCKGESGLDIPGYHLPFAQNSITLNPVTGDLIWDYPTLQGEFNIAFVIKEYRAGVLIGQVTRDMQITIAACNNHPPVIAEIKDTCVEAGTYLSFVVAAHDQDFDVVTLIGNGGPLSLTDGPAQFNQPVQGATNVSSLFKWQTKCSHVRLQPYQMVFKATDNSNPVHLVDFESVNITVVGPSPKNLVANSAGNNIHLVWNKSACTNAIGYKIYRKSSYYGFFPDHCETGVPAYTGYSYLATINDILDTNFTDNNNGQGLIHGIDYCYMVYAIYPDGAESYASLEACAHLTKDVPIITNVSIENTSNNTGKVYTAWSKPSVLDTNVVLGPFKYKIYRANNHYGTGNILIDSTMSINDTTYVDSLISPLNTVDFPYSYKVELYNETPGDSFLIGTTHIASSVYLSLIPSDNTLQLTWKENVPWTNSSYVIFKKNPITLNFDSLTTVFQSPYLDTGLTNGVEYCYYVKSKGSYSIGGIINPIINLSQRVCGVPIDKTPPCPPKLRVLPDCDKVQNLVIWTNPNHTCASDVVKYNLYYSSTNNSNLDLLQSFNNASDTFYLHTGLTSIAGCYAVTAIDSFNNESAMSEIICVDIDSCHLYELPNIITPNGDGYNDFFHPFPYSFVEKIDIKIYNRWGQIVFKSEDPDINWDGKSQQTNSECSDGVYFYICDVYELRLSGSKKRTLKGSVHLYREL
ncbi:MAG: gliding motility-associated C-terminal domain-containing protein, partial [Bacteroidetes bacterium]|nr:gliding motility-associated C-terminal domain-containing protein [Bacteroidota bacterium]